MEIPDVKEQCSHLVIQAFCYRGTQISQIRLNVTIHYLLIENVNLEEEVIKGEKAKNELKVIVDKTPKLSKAQFPGLIATFAG